MSVWFTLFDDTTGEMVSVGQCPKEEVASQSVNGLTAFYVPNAAIKWPSVDIEPVKEYLRSVVDDQAEEFRLRFVTRGAGQALEYNEAVSQAQAFLADPEGDYPMLQADINALTIDPRTGEPVATLAEATSVILYLHAQWCEIGAAIRQARLTAKNAITASSTIPEMYGASYVDWSALIPTPEEPEPTE